MTLRLWGKPKIGRVYSVHNGTPPSVVRVGYWVSGILPEVPLQHIAVHVVGNIDSLLSQIPSSCPMTLPSILVQNHASRLRTLFLVIQEQFPQLGMVFLL